MHKRWSMLVALLLIPTMIAQSDGEEAVVVVEDGSGDHGNGQGRSDLIDLQAKWNNGNITWILHVSESNTDGKTPLADDTWYGIHFLVGAKEYIAYADRSPSIYDRANDDVGLSSGLMELRNGLWVETEDGPEPIDNGTTITWTMPDAWLYDERDAPLLPGHSLTNLWVESQTITNEEQDQQDPTSSPPQDRMPDEGSADPLTKPTDPAREDVYYFFSEAPVRTSNGGPSLLVYELQLYNSKTVTEDFSLEIQGYPEQWNTRLSAESMQVGPRGKEEVYVVIESEGGHRHGADDVFKVIATAADGTATQNLALHYPKIPELSGHHPQVWFHGQPEPTNDVPGGEEFDASRDAAFAPYGVSWMNTIEVDEADRHEAYTARTADGNYVWTIPLGPAPRLGFDFDLNGTGNIAFSLGAAKPKDIEQVDVAVFLEAFEDGTWIQVAQIEDPDPVTVQAAGTAFDLALTPTRDTVPYHPDLELRFRIQFPFEPTSESTGTGANDPLLMPGGTAFIPMDEYLDPLTPELAALLQDEGVIDEEGDIIAAAETNGQEAPGFGAIFVIATMGMAALLRRRV